MEQVFWVKNGDLKEVNKYLQKGGRVKSIHAVSESVSAYGCGAGGSSYTTYGKYEGR